jgi:hypothetical protein
MSSTLVFCRSWLRTFSTLVALGCATVATGQTVTGSFAPSTVGASAASSLSLSYSGFTSNSSGMNLRLYYNNAAVVIGTVAYNAPPGASQAPSAPEAGTLPSCVGANEFITLNWADINGTWPTPVSGALATIPVTTTAGFNANTNVCWEDDITNGAIERNISGSAILAFAVTPSTAVFTISTPVNVTEGGGTANATVTCTGAFASNQVTPVSLAFTASNSAGNFTTSASPLSFASCGGSTQTITVTPRADDATVQGAVTGGIALTAPAAAVGTIGNPGASVVNVADNDTPAVVTIAVDPPTSATEAGGVLTYRITRTGGNQTVALPVNITPPAVNARYSTTCASPVNIAANAPAATCIVTGIDNAVTDGNINVAVTVVAGTNYTVGSPATATGTLTDDDGPQTVTVAVAPATVAENSGTNLVYTFTRTANAAQQAVALTANVTPPAVNAARYTGCAITTVTFAAGSLTNNTACVVTPVDTAVLDGNVNVVVGVAAPSTVGAYTVGSPATATGAITDNEVGVGVVATASSISEGGVASFTLSCTGTGGPFAIPYTLGGTVPSDGAPSSPSPVSLTCGTPVIITIQTADNTVPADSRSITLTLGALPAGAALTPGAGAASVNVADNDGPPPTIPTMGVFGLGLLSLLIAGIGGFVQRRRK